MSTVNLENKTILVTGAAGFIGSNLVKRIYEEVPSATVIGIDNMNVYYDVALKEFRLNELAKYPTFTFVKGNIADKELITDLFEKYPQNEKTPYSKYFAKPRSKQLLYTVYSGRGLHCICRAGQESVSLVWRERQQECSHRVQPAEWYGVEASDPHPPGDGLH